MTETPNQGHDPLDDVVEPLEAVEEPFVEEPIEEPVDEFKEEEPTAGEEDESPPTKRCLFCGAQIPGPAKACRECGHALGPFDPNTPKEYFRWFFCGLIILIGSLMPCGPDWGTMTIRTMLGGLFAIMGLGVMWNMWGAIYSGRFKMFWVVMLFIPAIWGVWRVAFAFAPQVELTDAIRTVMDAKGVELAGGGDTISEMALYGGPLNWGDLLSCFSSAPPDWSKFRSFFWVIGYGPIFITFASLLAWFFLISSMFSAVKHTKQKAANRASSGGRIRRR